MAAEIILAVLVVIGLLALGGALPLLGVFMSLFSPVPFVLLRLRHGLFAFALALGLTALALFGLSSSRQPVAFLLEFGVPTVLLAEGLHWKRRPEVVVTGVATLLTLGGIGVLVFASGNWTQPLEAVSQHVEGLLQDTEALSARLGLVNDGAVPLYGSMARLRGFMLMAFPSLFFTGSLLTATGYVLTVRALSRRWPAQFGGADPQPFHWELPERLVWVFILGGVLYLTELPWLRGVGLNGLIILIGLYFLQGLSIAAFLFQRFRLPRLLGAVSVLLLLFQPFLTLVVAGVGLFDVWFGFRRLSVPKTPGQT
jgi:uncharacterized protein YybS (DUF2232 family)